MKKLLILLLFTLVLTGCNNTLSLDFNDKIDAKIELSFSLGDYMNNVNEPTNKENLIYSIDAIKSEARPLKDSYDIFFTTEVLNKEGDNYTGEYTYSYTYSNFKNNTILDKCFENFIYEEDDNAVHIYLNGESMCAPFKLKVKSDNRMLLNNSTDKNKGEYIWEVKDKENDIRFDISKAPIEAKEFKTSNIIYIILAIILSAGVYFLNKKLKNS